MYLIAAKDVLRRWQWLRVVAIPLLLLAQRPETALGWGDRGHRLVNAAAIENLPAPLRSYIDSHRTYLIEHASDPDFEAKSDPAERGHHFTDLDSYDSFPFLRLRRQFVLERAVPKPWQVRHGDSIWQIEKYTLQLADSLTNRRWQDAERDAVFAAHYAADLTQPLHTTRNYDGQLTGQSGVHARFESELVNALADGWRLEPRPAIAEVDLRARIFRELTVSFSCRDALLKADRTAVEHRSYLDPQYFAVFSQLAGPLAKQRLEAGASFVSSLWYTAWVRAGKPNIF